MTGDELIIRLSSNFLYNPMFGNLLLTVSSSNFSTAPTNGFFQKEEACPGGPGCLPAPIPMSRVIQIGYDGGIEADYLGLITGFSFVPPGQTPLPAAFPLFATGLGALGLLGWRRKRKGAAAITAA